MKSAGVAFINSVPYPGPRRDDDASEPEQGDKATLSTFFLVCQIFEFSQSRTPPPLDLIGMPMVGKKPANTGLGTSIAEALFRQRHAKLIIASDGPCPIVSIQ